VGISSDISRSVRVKRTPAPISSFPRYPAARSARIAGMVLPALYQYDGCTRALTASSRPISPPPAHGVGGARPPG
jgi:hypothetical protein